jgi:hypothetical protein
MEAGLRTLVLALYKEAALTATAKGLTGPVGELAALRETASLASGPARRPVSEEEVMRVLLSARRTRRSVMLPTVWPVAAVAAPPASLPASSVSAPARPPTLRLRRGRLAARAMRSLARHASAALI